MLIRSFLASLYREKLRKVTISRKVAALRSFYRYLLREGKVRFNPAELLQLPRCEKYIPVVLSVDEILSLLRVNFSENAAGLRDRAMHRAVLFRRHPPERTDGTQHRGL